MPTAVTPLAFICTNAVPLYEEPVVLFTYCFTSMEVMATDPMLSIVRVKTPTIRTGVPGFGDR